MNRARSAQRKRKRRGALPKHVQLMTQYQDFRFQPAIMF
jgi:hypothetical protein